VFTIPWNAVHVAVESVFTIPWKPCSRSRGIRTYVPAERLGSIPVYILTSHGTFSAGENFAYVLQAAKRATVVGEVTAGAANIGRLHRIDKRFEIWIPDARPISTFTGTNWEGKGVIPDVKVPGWEALNVARMLAAQALASRSKISAP
jgi:C-terminal processing protease CtpA/Prc